MVAADVERTHRASGREVADAVECGVVGDEAVDRAAERRGEEVWERRPGEPSGADRYRVAAGRHLRSPDPLERVAGSVFEDVDLAVGFAG
jgi:hypothetical protein